MKIKRSELKQLAIKYFNDDSIDYQNKILIKIAVARCARLSYANYNGDIDYNKDIILYQRLLDSGHMSPFEHCLVAMSEDEMKMFVKTFLRLVDGEYKNVIEQGWCNNFRGWITHRYLVETN